ncbi:unnamed protein product [Lasius platythorax]|uniref:Uncharacterized protein n=1 Tax=Lasius platythorax TaxID=488582 RepID=A0AAV2N9X0_9HYME
MSHRSHPVISARREDPRGREFNNHTHLLRRHPIESQCHRCGGTGDRPRGHGPGGPRSQHRRVVIANLSREERNDGVSRGGVYDVPQGVKRPRYVTPR